MKLLALSILLAAVCATAVPAHAATAPPRSWAAAEVELAIARGVFDGTPATFRPDAPLTRQALERAVARLTGRAESTLANGAAPATVEQLDAALVRAVGLAGAATRLQRAARAAGLEPPRRFGTEAVARLLGLRVNHPAPDDALELRPDEPATRAEAAYSIARILSLSTRPGGPAETIPTRRPASTVAPAMTDLAGLPEVERVRELVRAFELPSLDERQRRVLAAAVSYAGFPYVWGGTGDGTPGFDCSGFVWRVFRLTEYPEEPALAGVLRGRTTMEMSSEVPRTARIAIEALEPGDVLFFGRGPRSRPAQVDHSGIYLGGDWMIHSSRYGVALAPLDSWYRDTFAWARRPLAEAGPMHPGTPQAR